MKLELPDNNASVLFHMGNALQSIARDIDTSLPVNGHKTTHTGVSGMTPDELSDTVDKMIESVAADWKVPVNRLTGNTTDAEQYGKSVLSDCLDSIDESAESIGIIRQQASDATVEVSDTIDADGLPWDQRVHSRGKTRLADNTWRLARKPNDKTDEEWVEYVEGVKTELKALMAIPVTVTCETDPFAVEPPIANSDVGPFYWSHPESDSCGIVQTKKELIEYLESDLCCVEVDKEIYDRLVNELNRTPEAIAPPVDAAVIAPPVDAAVIAPPVDAAVIAPPVVDAVVTPPVVDAVVTPPVVDTVVTPPVVDAVVTPGPTTFPELMKFITVNNKKLTKESVDEALKAQGLASIALLAARTDLIPQVHAALVKLL